MLLVSVYLILLFPLIVVFFSPSVFFSSFFLLLFSLCVASVALALVFVPGLYSTAYRATFPAFYAVTSSLFLLSVCFCLCFLFYRDDVLCWLLSCPFSSVCFPCLSPLSGLIWFGSLSCDHGWIRSGSVNVR